MYLHQSKGLANFCSHRLHQLGSKLYLSFNRGLASHQNVSSNVLETLRSRHLLQEIFPVDRTRELARHLASRRSIYAGIDPTANDLHVGHLTVLNALQYFYRAGHNVVIVIGGATAKLGDPSGKEVDRVILPQDEIESNSIAIKKCIQRVVTSYNSECQTQSLQTQAQSTLQEKLLRKERAEMNFDDWLILDNSDWYKDVNVIDFISSSNVRMGEMLKRRFVRDRLASPRGLSFREFAYQLFQAQDWLHLYKHHNCTLQIGGSDQLGNAVSGYDLIQRNSSATGEDLELFALFLPLIKSEFGEKLGKSNGSPIWLSSSKTSVFDFYQYFIRIPDSQVHKLLCQLTFLPSSEIEDALKKHKEHPEKRGAQKKLATEVTRLVHGQEGLKLAEEGTKILYESDISALTKLDSHQLQLLFQDAGYKRVMYEAGLTLAALAVRIGCVRTEREADDVIRSGGFFVNQAKRLNPEEIVVPGLHILMENTTTLVRIGKKRYYIIEWEL